MKKRRERLIKRVRLSLVLFCECVVLTILAWMNLKIHAEDEIVPYGKFFWDDTKATIGFLNVNLFLKRTGDVKILSLGENRLEYSCLGKKATRTVFVKDMEPPVITLDGDEIYELDNYDIKAYKEVGYSAMDNYDGDMSRDVEKELISNGNRSYTMVYSIVDSSGNRAEAKRTIITKPRGTVYLTFDDGPSVLTPEYLDVLKEYGINATFFVIGFEDKDEEWRISVTKRALEEENSIALHGYSHEYSEIYQSVETATENFYRENEILKNELGIDSKIIRFPGGSSNTVSKKYCEGVMSEATEAVLSQGYIYFDWNIDSNDAGSDIRESKNIYDNVIEEVRPNRDNVVLMHDSWNHQATLEALPLIIEKLQSEGYDFKTITMETEPVTHHVNN